MASELSEPQASGLGSELASTSETPQAARDLVRRANESREILAHFVLLSGLNRAVDEPEPSVRKNPTVVAAILTAVGGLVVGALALTGQLATDAPPDCIAKAQKYEAVIGHDQKQVDLLVVPGSDGKSILSADEDAVTCGIDEETLRRMAQQ